MTARKSPRIEALVVNAIKRLQDVQGSTSREISNYISQEYNVPAPKVRKQVNMALRRGLSFGILHRSKGGYYSCGDQDIRNRAMDTDEVILRGGHGRCKSHSRRRKHMKRSRRDRCKSHGRRSRRGRRKSRKRSHRRGHGCKPKSARRRRRSRRRSKMGKCCDGDAGDRVTFSNGQGPRNAKFTGTTNGNGGSSGSDLSGERHVDDVATGEDVLPSPENCLD